MQQPLIVIAVGCAPLSRALGMILSGSGYRVSDAKRLSQEDTGFEQANMVLADPAFLNEPDCPLSDSVLGSKIPIVVMCDSPFSISDPLLSERVHPIWKPFGSSDLLDLGQDTHLNGLRIACVSPERIQITTRCVEN